MAILDPQGAVFARLNSQSSVTNIMDTYTPVGGVSGPALFSSAVPPDHKYGPKASAIIDAPTSNQSDDTATEEYRDIVIRVRLYNAPDGSNQTLMQAAETIRDVLKNWPDEVIGGATYKVVSVSGPDAAPTTDPIVDGLLLSVRLLIKES